MTGEFSMSHPLHLYLGPVDKLTQGGIGFLMTRPEALQQILKIHGHPAESYCVAPLVCRADNGYRSFETALVLILLIIALPVGCGPAALVKPAFKPAQTAARAVADADLNGDGLLSEDELKKYPALLGAVSQYDTDKDGSLSGAELEAQLLVWQERGAALRSLNCLVLLNGKPLSEAQVEFVPESFLSEIIQPCSGISDDVGRAVMSLADEHLPSDLKRFPSIHLGMYQVRVTHPSREIPAKYNEHTNLGQIVGPTTLNVTLNLSSK